MTTVNLGHYFSVTVRHPKKMGPGEFAAEGTIHRRDTQKPVSSVTGTGGRATSAQQAAVNAARLWAGSRKGPDDWSGLEGLDLADRRRLERPPQLTAARTLGVLWREQAVAAGASIDALAHRPSSYFSRSAGASGC